MITLFPPGVTCFIRGCAGLSGGPLTSLPATACLDKPRRAPFDPPRGGASDEQEDFAMKVWIASAPSRSGARAFAVAGRLASFGGAGLMTLMLAIAAGSPVRAQAPAPAQPAPKAQPKAAPKAAPQQAPAAAQGGCPGRGVLERRPGLLLDYCDHLKELQQSPKNIFHELPGESL